MYSDDLSWRIVSLIHIYDVDKHFLSDIFGPKPRSITSCNIALGLGPSKKMSNFGGLHALMCFVPLVSALVGIFILYYIYIYLWCNFRNSLTSLFFISV